VTAGWIYAATVRHARKERAAHTFNSPALFVQVDIHSGYAGTLLALDRRRPLSILGSDYLGGGGEPLRSRLARWLPGLESTAADERVFLTTTPRVFGYAFNPISVFVCVDRENRPRRGLVEVHNTYGEAHLYPLPEIDGSGCARAPKELFVSPFFGIDGEYAFHFSAPGPRLAFSVVLERGGEMALGASMAGEGRPLSDGAVFAATIARPLSALLVHPRIAWQALVLQYRKGLQARMRPIARSERTVVRTRA
jgi:DUF1365 family protein